MYHFFYQCNELDVLFFEDMQSKEHIAFFLTR